MCPFYAIVALQNIATFVECTEKDERNKFTSQAFTFCPTWPFIGDSCSVHFRHGVPRLCWDKSGPRGIPRFTPFNQSLPLEDLPIIAYVTVCVSAREMAVFHSSGAPTRMWKCDLSKAYRRAGRQKLDWWKQGRITHQGCTLDFRGQFGDASQPNYANRIWFHAVWVARRLLRDLDQLFPVCDPVLLAWVYGSTPYPLTMVL